MNPRIDDFPWSEVSERAAQLVAAGYLTYQEIADRLEVSRSTVKRWKKSTQFAARVDEHLAEIREEVRRVGIADIHRRVAALNDRWNRMRRVIEARADDPKMADVPGGNTGLLVRTLKRIVVEDNSQDGEGRTTSQEVAEYSVDTGLLKELRDHEKQAAQELGQWAEKHQIAGEGGGPLRVIVLGSAASMDDL